MYFEGNKMGNLVQDRHYSPAHVKISMCTYNSEESRHFPASLCAMTTLLLLRSGLLQWVRTNP